MVLNATFNNILVISWLFAFSVRHTKYKWAPNVGYFNIEPCIIFVENHLPKMSMLNQKLLNLHGSRQIICVFTTNSIYTCNDYFHQ